MFEYVSGSRVRTTPFHQAVVAAGMNKVSVYNRMIIPLSFGDLAAEYDRLIHGVAMWDVSCERQLQVTGPDAETLVQLLTARDISTMVEGQGRYVAMCGYDGRILNDPVLLKLSGGRWWFSLADQDMLLFAEGVAGAKGLDVEVIEPDVSPLAVQGPDAENVVAALFGDHIRDIKLFRFIETDLDGIPIVLCRSGWSRQGGFELFLEDGSRAVELWNLVAEAGKPWDIGPGAPNGVERVESGLFSYGTDNAPDSNPLECGMARFVDATIDIDYIGNTVLAAAAADGPRRSLVGFEFDAPAAGVTLPWAVDHRTPALVGDEVVGHVSTVVLSPRLEKVIGLGQVLTPLAEAQEPVRFEAPTGWVTATPVDLPFL